MYIGLACSGEREDSTEEQLDLEKYLRTLDALNHVSDDKFSRGGRWGYASRLLLKTMFAAHKVRRKSD